MNKKRNIITLAHGSGGRATSDLINSTIIKHFGVQNPESLQKPRVKFGNPARARVPPDAAKLPFQAPHPTQESESFLAKDRSSDAPWKMPPAGSVRSLRHRNHGWNKDAIPLE